MNFALFLTGPSISIEDKLIPNLYAFITQFLAFIILVIIVIRFAYKPVHNYITKRREFINSNLEEAQRKNSEADSLNKLAQENINNAKQEASSILLQVKKQAQEDKKMYSKQLAEEISLKRKQAQKELENEKQQAIKEAKAQIVDLAIQASSTLLNKEVDSKDNRKLIDEFIDDISSKEE